MNRLKEFTVKHALFSFESHQDEVVVGGKGVSELKVKGGLRLVLREEALEIIIEAEFRGPPSGQQGQYSDEDQDPPGAPAPECGLLKLWVCGHRVLGR